MKIVLFSFFLLFLGYLTYDKISVILGYGICIFVNIFLITLWFKGESVGDLAFDPEEPLLR